MKGDWIKIDQLRAFGILGLHDWERSRAQEILIDATLELDLRPVGDTDRIENGLDYGILAKHLVAHAEASERFTVEALATDLAGMCLHRPQVRVARVTVSKPGADPHARRIGANVERRREDLMRRAVLGIGSNVEPTSNLQEALGRLSEIGKVIKTSKLYESEAEGGDDQPNYVNGAVMIETCLPPTEIRRRSKLIERTMGRDPCNKPRVPIDIDLCLVGDTVVETGGVRIPHPDILERAYLARSIADLDDALTHPGTGRLIAAIADELWAGRPARVRDDIVLDHRDG